MIHSAAAIHVSGIVKSFATESDRLTVIDGVGVHAAANEFVTIVGPSGSGKSTLLRITATLEEADSGEITIGGDRPDPQNQRIGFVFQGDSLLPWRTIEQNIKLGLEGGRDTSARQRARVAAVIELVGLSGFERYYPYQVSGGMRQRAAVARAFAIEPQVLLMDEPFGSVDVQMRASLQAELMRIWERLKTTVLFVTHDVEEAITLSDRIVVFTPRPARVREVVSVGLPRPRDPFSQRFVALRRQIQQLLNTDGA